MGAVGEDRDPVLEVGAGLKDVVGAVNSGEGGGESTILDGAAAESWRPSR